ncbi:hypothetical protein ACQ856_13915 [Mycolicibacterium psychrotolerans]|uniref:hypothetical protein n=1 Tax=Mycolicibacterium psychrotolerans TaxID=216929 RepID=UPI003D670488
MAATVVVANPLAPPSRDMQISTTQLSTSPDLLSPSDKSLLSALTPRLPSSDIGPALAQILAALAADADRISREVSSAINPEPSMVAALPEQTAYRPDSIGSGFVESPNATPAPSTTGFVTSVVSSDVVQALNGLVLDTSYLGGKVVEAAYAVVAVIIRVPQFVITAALDLLNGDIAGALDTVKAAIRAFWGPGLIILDGIRDVLYGRRAPAIPPPAALKNLVASATASAGTEAKPVTSEPATDTATPAPSAQNNKAGSARKPDTTPTAASLRPTTTTKSADSGNSGTDTSTPTKGRGDSKPSTGTTRSTAGSARDSKNSSSAGSSTD